MIHAVVDIESLGDAPNSIIVSIGAVAIDPFAEDPWLAKFAVNVSPDSCASAGLTMTEGTVDWWMGRKGAGWPTANRVDLYIALQRFADWYQRKQCERLWAHATFDPVLIGNAYRAVNLPIPWNYRDPRDLRTLQETVDLLNLEVPHFESTEEHVALPDAIAEAAWVIEALRAVKSHGRSSASSE